MGSTPATRTNVHKATSRLRMFSQVRFVVSLVVRSLRLRAAKAAERAVNDALVPIRAAGELFE